MEALEPGGLRRREPRVAGGYQLPDKLQAEKLRASSRTYARKQSYRTLKINLKLRRYGKWLELLRAINSDAAKFARIHYCTTPSARLRNLMIYDMAR